MWMRNSRAGEEPMFEQKRAEHLSWGAVAAEAFWGQLWGLITVGEKSRRRKQHTEPHESYSESRTVAPVWLPPIPWGGRGSGNNDQGPKLWLGAQGNEESEHPGARDEIGMTLEARVRNSMMEETAPRERPGPGSWPLPDNLSSSPSPSPTSAIPGLRDLSSGSNWGTPGPQGAGVGGESGYDKGDISWLAEMISRHVFCRGQQYGVYRDVYICR